MATQVMQEDSAKGSGWKSPSCLLPREAWKKN